MPLPPRFRLKLTAMGVGETSPFAMVSTLMLTTTTYEKSVGFGNPGQTGCMSFVGLTQLEVPGLVVRRFIPVQTRNELRDYEPFAQVLFRLTYTLLLVFSFQFIV